MLYLKIAVLALSYNDSLNDSLRAPLTSKITLICIIFYSVKIILTPTQRKIIWICCQRLGVPMIDNEILKSFLQLKHEASCSQYC